jgi:GT2 family glycosyltransferase
MRTAGLAHAGIAVGPLLYFRDRPLDGRRPLVGPSGGAALVPMAAWRDGGGLWERFFAWGEDADLALRLWHAGWRTEVVPVASLHHAGGHSVADRQGQRRKAGLLARNRVLLWARLADWRLAVPLVPVWACGALAICALHLPERTAGATVTGFAEGIRGWRDARRSLPAGERLGPADWLRLRRAG